VAACRTCGAVLPWWRVLFFQKVCANCARQRVEQIRYHGELVSAARAQYAQLSKAMADGTAPLVLNLPVLAQLEQRAELSAATQARIADDAVRTYTNRVLAHANLTDAEAGQLEQFARACGIDGAALQARLPDVLERISIARANAGTLPAIPSPSMICKKNEIVHLETGAHLLKEHLLREYRGGYSGFSFRIMKGVSYHVGGSRGHSVVVGKEIVADDVGTLAVSSQRIVFMGRKATMEIPFTKLVNMQVFTDGIQFHASNRKTAPLFRVQNGEVVAAFTNAAIQRSFA
jgi:hypothetical protein